MRILLIEDDQDLCHAIMLSLEDAGYQTDVCHSGYDALLYVDTQYYDCLILDRMLPGMDGLTLLEVLRKRGIQTPMILATALNGIHDRIHGLDAGADDYLVKPFAIEELLARIRAVTRRPGQMATPGQLTFAGITLSPDNHQMTFFDQVLTLSKRESALLACFFRNGNQVLTRPLLLSYVWGSDAEVEDGNLDNYVYFLRRRLKSIDAPARIVTIHGVGYRLEECHV